MKKFVLVSAAAALLIGVLACTQKGDVADASTFSKKITNCSNADSINAYIGQAKAYVEKLVKDGKVKEAQEYIDKIEPAVKEKSPAAASAISSIKAVVDKAAGVTETTVDKTKEIGKAVGDKTKDLVEKVGDKTKDVAEKVGDKAKDVKDDVKDKIEDLKKK